MKKIHYQIAKTILDHVKEKYYQPSMTELAKILGYASKKGVHYQLQMMAKSGYIILHPYSRAVEFTEEFFAKMGEHERFEKHCAKRTLKNNEEDK